LDDALHVERMASLLGLIEVRDRGDGSVPPAGAGRGGSSR
jgi:hypothetical protein